MKRYIACINLCINVGEAKNSDEAHEKCKQKLLEHWNIDVDYFTKGIIEIDISEVTQQIKELLEESCVDLSLPEE